MRVKVVVPVVAGLMLAAPAAASAMFVHVVAPGESLYSVAAVDGLSVAQLAAANGLPLDTQLIAGSTLIIPPQQTGALAPLTSAASPAVSAPATLVDGDGDSDGDVTATSTSATTTSTTAGSYVVQPGDTLTAIAARAGLSVSSLAAANGLDPAGLLISGTVLRLTGTPQTTTFVSTTSQQPVGAVAQGDPTAPPYPTPERVTASQVGQIAASNGVSPSLAAAVAYQESGFNNDLVSSADARGVMQILPGTWDWIQHTLVAGAPPLAPASANDNVRGGVYLLRWLLNSSGGDPAVAAAGYYQGLPSVRRYGMFRSTQQYVGDVLALRQRFGGP